MDQIKSFVDRHIGIGADDQKDMLDFLGYSDMSEFIEAVVPKCILEDDYLELGDGLSEMAALKKLDKIAKQNVVCRSYIGQGYYGTVTPKVIKRNVFENPGWYTSYTPYQAEISQGRLEALINFQTTICELTSMEIANASLLDEATAAAEAMMLAKRVSKNKSNSFFVDKNCFDQTIAVLETRAKPFGIVLEVGDPQDFEEKDFFGMLVQYPNKFGDIKDFSKLSNYCKKNKSLLICATDLLALTLMKPPGEIGADIVIGSSQRFGVPMGFGGPHAAFMATHESFQRSMPGRIIGASKDVSGNLAYRLALQTREQHIRREKATSNICTSQALLAVMAGFFAIYHGPKGLIGIANDVHKKTCVLFNGIEASNHKIVNNIFFDTLSIRLNGDVSEIKKRLLDANININWFDEDLVSISIDEATTSRDVADLIFALTKKPSSDLLDYSLDKKAGLNKKMLRTSSFMKQERFHKYHSETEMMRYIKRLSDKDIALDRSMIPLGSCTMKLNSASEMAPVSWPEFANMHPYCPTDQTEGYQVLIRDLKNMLSNITGYYDISLQPNAGSQGEYAGLLAIDAYHKKNGDNDRSICLIPRSAHGTNPASAMMVGMKVVPVECDSDGNIDLEDLKDKSVTHKDDLSAIMITYPSTHGVFESNVREVCKIVHDHGGLVYIDGANLNALVGIAKPGEFGGDVSHLNLHKTFCIPHGGGGPGVGPIGVVEKLKDFMPSHHKNIQNVGPVSSTDFGSASILPISWMYIAMMGSAGLKLATMTAILSANYVAKRLSNHYQILYKGENNLIAHECIIDVRPFKESSNIDVDDIAKRLMDYGFHAPTMSWPVAGTLMIEPTESESRQELDIFCDAMISIRKEIEEIEKGDEDPIDNILKNSPHTIEELSSDDWQHNYSREKAAYPLDYLKVRKYWPPVKRIDNVYGDKNLYCTCPNMDEF
tara:strand:+ start:7103 stop:9931 length:2829 start_codon:yes stop_codon:yes gene_type:complete